MKKCDAILWELKEHLPFTLGASLVAGILVAIFYLFGRLPSEELFEIMHPAHVFVSAMATSIIYWKYKEKNIKGLGLGVWGKSVLVGVVGAILVGSLSDVLFPWLAGNLFSLHTHFHLPIIEKPFLILGIAFIGSVVGMYWKSFNISHSLHVFLSIFASLFYLLAFSIEMSVLSVLLISFLVFLCVYIPCCVSDVVFPLFFIKKSCGECGHWH